MNFIIIALLLFSSAFLLFFIQHKMIYYPRPYADGAGQLNAHVIEIEYSTGQGKQVAFYVPPKVDSGSTAVKDLWVLFGGNASLALDWQSFVDNYPEKNTAFLLVDYPGYGKCAGRSSNSTILAASQAALQALAVYLKVAPEQLTSYLNALGHSLGAATALQFSVKYPIKRVVLIAPFTSLRDMATKVVGKALAFMLIHNYDNRARIKELAARDNPPAITIIHGRLDNIVPVTMGRELAGLSTQLDYQEIKEGDHNLILSMEEKRIYAAMQRSAETKSPSRNRGGKSKTTES